MRLSSIAVSPCCNPDLPLAAALAAYAALGFRAFEVFTSWVASAFDISREPTHYLNQARPHGLRYCSCHLPPVRGADLDASLATAIAGARFAARLGARVVLFKASDRPTYMRSASRFLDATEGLGMTTVLQNHFGTPISSLADFREVLAGIADPRMRTLLEVGHFHSAGVGWREGADLLGDTIALVHVKDQIGAQSVAFGAGEIDLPGLFSFMDQAGYTGDYVLEMEVKDKGNTLTYLRDAYAYVARYCEAPQGSEGVQRSSDHD